MSSRDVPVIHPSLIERFEYEIDVVDNGGLSMIDKASSVTINIQELGNTLEFRRKKTPGPLLKIPLANIETATAITAQTKRLMSKKITYF